MHYLSKLPEYPYNHLQTVALHSHWYRKDYLYAVNM